MDIMKRRISITIYYWKAKISINKWFALICTKFDMLFFIFQQKLTPVSSIRWKNIDLLEKLRQYNIYFIFWGSKIYGIIIFGMLHFSENLLLWLNNRASPKHYALCWWKFLQHFCAFEYFKKMVLSVQWLKHYTFS